MEKLSRKVIAVVGASSDLGIVITRDLIQRGHEISAHYAHNPVELQKFNSPNLMLFQADLSKDREVQDFARVTKEKFGRVDVLINMIGPFSEARVLEQSPTAWRESIELNLNVVYSACYYFQQEIVTTRGQVVNFGYAGIENLTAWPNATSYAAAKAGLGVLTKSLAQAMAPSGVRVNAICPGWIDSGHFDATKKEKILASIPVGRIGDPEEISNLLQWLIFQSPTYITGALIPIGGAIEF